MNTRQRIETRMRRMLGMSADKRAEVAKAQGSQLWWARCWNCKKPVQMIRNELDHANCPHCGVNLWKRNG